MRIIEDVLYLELAELVKCGVSEGYLRKAKSTKTKCWSFIKDPEDGRRVLVEYEALKDNYKKLIIKAYGDPYERVARQPILDLVKEDLEAERFYQDYTFNGHETLPPAVRRRYTIAANWLNMIKEVNEDKKALKEHLNLNVTQFYDKVLSIIKTDKIDLPTTYRRLVVNQDSALKKYIKDGYPSLISWKWGNQNRAKVKKGELSMDVLHEMIAHHNQHDDVYVCMQYNNWASQTNHEEISVSTVAYHRTKYYPYIVIGREGQDVFNNKLQKRINGKRPSAPLYLVENDDNHIDLLFIDPENPKAYPKYIAIVVMDSFNDYVLGYSYGLKLSIELVQAAYLNAMYHIRSLTGGWHLPHESKSDRWGLKSLTPMYKALGDYIPTPVGSKARGYIEQSFSRSDMWKRSLKIVGTNNFSGSNMTAIKRGVNTEHLQKARKDWPTIGYEAERQIEAHFHYLRYAPSKKGGISKHEEWVAAWNGLEDNQKRFITDQQFLEKFGLEHNHNGKGIQILNNGVNPKLLGKKRVFEPAQYHLEHNGKNVSIKYDPNDMSRVLLTDGNKLNIMAYEPKGMPRAIADHTTDTRKYLHAAFEEKKAIQGKVHTHISNRDANLKAHMVNPEGLLQAGYQVKELHQAATQQALNDQYGDHDTTGEDYSLEDNY